MRPLAYLRGLITASFLALQLLASTAHVEAAGPSIMSTSIIGTSQVDSTTFDYTIQAVLYNPGPDLVGATAIVTTDSANTEVIDGSVTFGRVASEGTAYSLDTFTIRQDRSASFNPQWQVIAIEDVSPNVSNFPPAQGNNNQRSVSGKVLSLAVARDDRTVYAGTFSGVWRSDDGGVNWLQATATPSAFGPGEGNDVPDSLAAPIVHDIALSQVFFDRNGVLAATGLGFASPPVFSQSRNGIYLSPARDAGWFPVHQFKHPDPNDPNSFPGKFIADPVGQIATAPDDPRVMYAAEGANIARSIDAGFTWETRPVQETRLGTTEGGVVWHIAVAPRDSGTVGPFSRKIYAAGQNQIWYSADGGETWLKDRGSLPSLFGNFPSGGLADSPQILAVEPGHSDHLYLAVTGTQSNAGPFYANGPRYYNDPAVKAGDSSRLVNAGEGSLWLGDYSAFGSGNAARWEQLPGPPTYVGGGSTISGNVYVLAKPTANGYLLFFSDNAHVHVSAGRPHTDNPGDPPEKNSSWHRLDGRDASESKRQGQLSNKLFVHPDPMAIAVSSDFEITLKKPSADLPDAYRRNSELDTYLHGTIWMGNDGGVYRSTDGGQTWSLTSGLSTLQAMWKFGAFTRLFRLFPLAPFFPLAPALYFGVPDNDNFFTLDGGIHWRDPVTNYGDAGPWFSDPALADNVLEFGGRDKPPGFGLYTRGPNEVYPVADNLTDRRGLPWPGNFPVGFYEFGSMRGYRPLILTPEDETAALDVILIRLKPDGTRVLLRTRKLSQITSPDDWDTSAFEDGKDTKVFQQGMNFLSSMNQADVVQASGGHNEAKTVFYVGDPAGSRQLWKGSGTGQFTWRLIVPSPPGRRPRAPEKQALEARRFFVDPYNPNLIYIVDKDGIKRSDDGGDTWELDMNLDQAVTEDKGFSYEIAGFPIHGGELGVINDMVFDRFEHKTRFAVGVAGVFFTVDGTNWTRLLSTRAVPGYPVAAFFDSDIQALYVAFNGRGILKLSPIPSP